MAAGGGMGWDGMGRRWDEARAEEVRSNECRVCPEQCSVNGEVYERGE